MTQKSESVREAEHAAEVLQKALNLFGPNGENWCQGSSYSLHGKPIPAWYPRPPLASVRCCAAAAITDSERTGFKHWERSPAYALLAKAINRPSVHEWNDDSERTFPEVKAAFEKAIAAAWLREKTR